MKNFDKGSEWLDNMEDRLKVNDMFIDDLFDNTKKFCNNLVDDTEKLCKVHIAKAKRHLNLARILDAFSLGVALYMVTYVFLHSWCDK